MSADECSPAPLFDPQVPERKHLPAKLPAVDPGVTVLKNYAAGAAAFSQPLQPEPALLPEECPASGNGDAHGVPDGHGTHVAFAPITPQVIQELIFAGVEPLHETLRHMEAALDALVSGTPSKKIFSFPLNGTQGILREYANSKAGQPSFNGACNKNGSAPEASSFKHLGSMSKVATREVCDTLKAAAIPGDDAEVSMPRPGTLKKAMTNSSEVSMPRSGTLKKTMSGEVSKGRFFGASFHRKNHEAEEIRAIARGKTQPTLGSRKSLRRGVEIVKQKLRTIPLPVEPERTSVGSKILSSSLFENLSSAVIIMNSLFVAYTSDWDMKHIGGPTVLLHQNAETAFLAFYAFEILLRLCVHGLFFFVNADVKWNLFDFILVSLSMLDTILVYAMGAAGNSNVSAMRIIRLLRLARILRTLRVMKVFRDLAQLLDSFRNCAISLFWSFVMMAFVLYIFALVFIQALAGYLQDAEDIPESVQSEVQKHFGSMATSMLSLYMSVTSGNDWALYYDILSKAGAIYGILFVFFVFFFGIALFNILTGVFVEKAVVAAQPNREELIVEQRRKTKEDYEEFRHLCHVLDCDGTGTISREEFMDSMRSDLMKSYMAAVGLEVRDVEIFFDLVVCKSGQTDIEIDRFAEGCMAMKGTATSFDMQKLLFEVHCNRELLLRISEIFEQHMEFSRQTVLSLASSGGTTLRTAATSDQLDQSVAIRSPRPVQAADLVNEKMAFEDRAPLMAPGDDGGQVKDGRSSLIAAYPAAEDELDVGVDGQLKDGRSSLIAPYTAAEDELYVGVDGQLKDRRGITSTNL